MIKVPVTNQPSPKFKEVIEYLHRHFGTHIWVAGSSALHAIDDKALWTPSDIDVFMRTTDGHMTILRVALRKEYDYHIVASTKHGYTLRSEDSSYPDIQLLFKKGDGSLEELFESFDISIACCAFNDIDTVLTTKRALDDLKERQFRMIKPEPAVVAMTRMIRYTHKGYTPLMADMYSILETSKDEQVYYLEMATNRKVTYSKMYS